MSWRHSLVKIAGHQVEELRRRLAEVLDRRAEAELRLAVLHAEAEAEARHADAAAEAGWYRLGYLEGWRARRDQTVADIAALASEEAGARDALTRAFEELKKYEQIFEAARDKALKAAARRESAEMDELGARRAVGK